LTLCNAIDLEARFLSREVVINTVHIYAQNSQIFSEFRLKILTRSVDMHRRSSGAAGALSRRVYHGALSRRVYHVALSEAYLIPVLAAVVGAALRTG
jgi:hypothetical protein